MPERRSLAHSAEQTEALGAALALAMPRPEEAPAVLYLEGELGAGKTALARGFLRGLGYPGPVRSPTFALLEIYAVDALVVAHIDLYRLADARDLEALGLRDLAYPGHVWLVEWPERAAEELPSADLTVELKTGTETLSREVIAISHTPFGAVWIARAVEFSAKPT